MSDKQETSGDVSPRAFAWGDAAVLAALALFTFRFVWFVKPSMAIIGVALLIACSLRTRSFDLPAAAMTGALCLYAALPPRWSVWPTYLLVPILVAIALAALRGFRRDLFAGVQPGRLGRGELGLIVLISATAAVALLRWVLLLEPDLSRFKAMLPSWPLLALFGAGTAFSVINAVLEEFVWRGVFQHWLGSIMSPPWAVTIQALSFGTVHYLGFPGGVAGAALATIYGAMLGALALRSGGLLAPLVAHIAADAVIFTIVAGRL